MLRHAKPIAFVAALIASTQSFATVDDDPHFESSKIFEYAGWVLYPVWSADQETFSGFYSHPSAEIPTVTGNVQRIWFQWTPSNEWWAFALNPTDFQGMIDTSEGAGASSDIVFAVEAVLAAGSTGIINGPSGLIVGGLLSDDPLASWIDDSSDPATLLDILAGVGYPVASVMSGALSGTPTQGTGTVGPDAKQALDCLRGSADSSGSGSNCMICACTTHLGAFTPTPPGNWTITTTVIGNRKKCEYRRNGTAPYWLTGRKWYCPSCASGSAANPAGTTSAHEYAAEDVLATDPCPPAPTGPIHVLPGQ